MEDRMVRARPVVLLALFVEILGGGAPSCLINPKDYPLAQETTGGEDSTGEAGVQFGSGGVLSGGRGGTGSLDGSAGSAARGGMAGIGGLTGGNSPSGDGTGGSSANAGSTDVGGTSADSGGEAGAAGSQSGAPAELGGSAGALTAGGASGSAGSGSEMAGTGAQSGATGGTSSVKRVFVTSQTFDGDFKAYGNTGDADGLKGANTVCMQAAAAAGLGGTWVAWLSVTGNDAINRVADVAPWFLVDGTTKAFDTHAQLGAPANAPVNMSEHGDIVSGPAWTGTTLQGTAHSARCGEWKNNGTSLGAWGDTGNAFDWSYKDTQYCSKTARLYCFEQ